MSIATPGVTISGYLADTSGNPVVGTVTFTLCNYGAYIPRITGSNELAQLVVSTTSASNGAWSITLYGNYQIAPINTYYMVQIVVPSAANAPWDEATLEQGMILNTPGSFDLSNQPVAFPPNPNPPGTIVVVPPATSTQVDGVLLPPGITSYTLATVAITGSYTDLLNLPPAFYDIALFVPGILSALQLVLLLPLERTVSFATNMGASVAVCGTEPTSTTVFTLYKNGVSFGTLTFTPASPPMGSGVFSTTATTFHAGDVLTIYAPSLNDATFANLGMTMTGAS